MTDSSPPKSALKGWKSIADYFGRDASTVMRWAASRGLPVRRMPGGGRSSVYAVPDELAAWLASELPATAELSPAPAYPISLIAPAAGSGSTAATLLAATPPQPQSPASVAPVPSVGRRRMWSAAAAVAGAAAVAAIVVGRSPPTAAVRAPFHDAATERAYLAATYDLDLRTPASLERARAEFGSIIARDPAAAPAYAALGETYLLLREYTAYPSNEAYRAAAAAAKAAIALSPDLVAAHRALAFVAFWGDHDIPAARAEFARARALDPSSAQTWHWYATALSANGEAASALDAIQQARRLEPQSTPIAADYGLIAYLAGRHDEGLAALHAVAAGSPDHMSTHRYLADLALARGDGATYLAEATVACRLRGDQATGSSLAAERAAFARGGEPALLAAIATRLERRPTTADGHFALAKIMALQGRTTDALAELRQAAAAHEAGMAALPGEIMLTSLAGEAAYDALRLRDSLAT